MVKEFSSKIDYLSNTLAQCKSAKYHFITLPHMPHLSLAHCVFVSALRNCYLRKLSYFVPHLLHHCSAVQYHITWVSGNFSMVRDREFHTPCSTYLRPSNRSCSNLSYTQLQPSLTSVCHDMFRLLSSSPENLFSSQTTSSLYTQRTMKIGTSSTVKSQSAREMLYYQFSTSMWCSKFWQGSICSDHFYCSVFHQNKKRRD